MLMNERLVRVQACIRKLAWLPPESSTVPFCTEQDGYFLPQTQYDYGHEKQVQHINVCFDDLEHILFARYR